MNTPNHYSLLPRRPFGQHRLVKNALLLAASLFLTAIGFAQTPGTIRGRVFNAGTGEYVEKARITIDGSGRETFTDNLGQYSLSNVPAGTVNLKAFRTGLVVETVAVKVTAGQVVQHDFNLAGFGTRPTADADAVQKLPQFQVSESREMDGAAIAINEQRFAPDMRNVITADEFGQTPEGNIGDLLKFVPGITINTGFGISRGISLNGVSDAYVPVTVNGFNLASPLEGTSRHVDPQNLSTNNISRIEVLYTPTPESPGMALAGSVNVVPRSAFERSKPVLNTNVFLLMREGDLTFDKTQGPGRKPTHKIHPGFNFSYVAPVNERFGYTVSGGYSRQFLNVEFGRFTWRGAGGATNGTTLPTTTPDNPYLTAFTTQSSNGVDTSRYSLGATVDYKLTAYDRVSFSLQYVYHTGDYNNRFIAFDVGSVTAGNFGPAFTRGNAGAGSVRLVSDIYERTNFNYTPSLTYRHNGPIWQADAGIGHSYGVTSLYHASDGYFFNTSVRRPGVTVVFDGITADRPGNITVTDPTTGAVVDPYRLDSFLLESASFHVLDTEKDHKNKAQDIQQSAFINVGREFQTSVPFALKTGLDFRRTRRDLNNGATKTLTFLGVDGATATPGTFAGNDNNAGFLVDPGNTQRPIGFGFPAAQWVSNTKAFELYKSNPAYFRPDETNAYIATVNNSKYADEMISSAYLRGDLSMLERRLKLVGGMRAEQTNVKAQGPLTDLTRNYQRDANGVVIRAANGTPLPINTDTLLAARLTRIERGQTADKEYLRLFPSLNASYTFRENFIARAAYYYSLGRPSFNQYAGGISLPDIEALNQTGQRITVSNAGIKSWDAKTARVMLEYYFQRVGVVSVAVFRRDIKNFFANTIFPSTPEFLALYGLDPSIYGQYEVSSQTNLNTGVRMEGVDLNYKQALTFLPHWARGVQLFANFSYLKTTGEASANFSGFVPRTYNWGASFSREKFNFRLAWNERSRNRGALVTVGPGVPANTWRWGAKQSYFTFSGEYYFYKSFAVYADLHNPVMNDDEIIAPGAPAYARRAVRQQYPGLWTIGIKSSF